MPTLRHYAETHHRSLSDRDGFWRERAALIDWETPFEQVLDYSRPPFARWFVGGRTNLCHNAVDRHLARRADQPALVFVSTETGQRRSYTYGELAFEVNRVAAMLTAQGVNPTATTCTAARRANRRRATQGNGDRRRRHARGQGRPI